MNKSNHVKQYYNKSKKNIILIKIINYNFLIIIYMIFKTQIKIINNIINKKSSISINIIKKMYSSLHDL